MHLRNDAADRFEEFVKKTAGLEGFQYQMLLNEEDTWLLYPRETDSSSGEVSAPKSVEGKSVGGNAT